MLFLEKDNCVRAGVESVAADGAIGFLVVDGMHKARNIVRGVSHVRNRRVGIEAGRMELVAVLHAQLSERLEVLGLNGFLHSLHALGYYVFRAELKQLTRTHRVNHASCAAGGLLVIRHDTNKRVHVRPVLFRCHLVRTRVYSIILNSHFPLDIASIQTTGCAARACTGNLRELTLVGLLDAEDERESLDKACVARGRRGQTSSSRERVSRDHVNLVIFQVRACHKHIPALINNISSTCTDGLEDALHALVGREVGLFLVVKPDAVLVEVGTDGNRGNSLQIVLVQSHRKRGVDWQVELAVTLAPVLDHSDVSRCARRRHKDAIVARHLGSLRVEGKRQREN
mmetsp:Transcript_18800/g.36846  ORF Transcript_18800/g.36846 Transcript_18800/m.36846 type:complete len:342 (-) Transcript_18800:95-1120(-)